MLFEGVFTILVCGIGMNLPLCLAYALFYVTAREARRAGVRIPIRWHVGAGITSCGGLCWFVSVAVGVLRLHPPGVLPILGGAVGGVLLLLGMLVAYWDREMLVPGTSDSGDAMFDV